ncbi:MAG: hypothetical protein KGI71_04950 [Patescibacteria group bacterium]|nr:hypothetical protein [Patescibacteria group bacterium]
MTREWKRRRVDRYDGQRAHLFIDGQSNCRSVRNAELYEPAEMNPETGLPTGLFCFPCQRVDRINSAVRRVARDIVDRRPLWLRALEAHRPASLRRRAS